MKKYLFILGLCISVALQGQGILSGVVAGKQTVGDLYGDEMLTNGALTGGTSWTGGDNFILTDDKANYTDLANGTLYQTNAEMVSSIAINTDYKLEFDITITSGNASLIFQSFLGGVDYVGQANYANGHHTVLFTTGADVGSKGMWIVGHTNSDNAFSIDNLSLKVVL